jgi:hypothetical protein
VAAPAPGGLGDNLAPSARRKIKQGYTTGLEDLIIQKVSLTRISAINLGKSADLRGI